MPKLVKLLLEITFGSWVSKRPEFHCNYKYTHNVKRSYFYCMKKTLPRLPSAKFKYWFILLNAIVFASRFFFCTFRTQNSLLSNWFGSIKNELRKIRNSNLNRRTSKILGVHPTRDQLSLHKSMWSLNLLRNHKFSELNDR